MQLSLITLDYEYDACTQPCPGLFQSHQWEHYRYEAQRFDSVLHLNSSMDVSFHSLAPKRSQMGKMKTERSDT